MCDPKDQAIFQDWLANRLTVSFYFRSPVAPSLIYLNLPNPTVLSVLIINPNVEFTGTRQKSSVNNILELEYHDPKLV